MKQHLNPLMIYLAGKPLQIFLLFIYYGAFEYLNIHPFQSLGQADHSSFSSMLENILYIPEC